MTFLQPTKDVIECLELVFVWLLGLRPRGTLSVLSDALDRADIDFDGVLWLLERLLEHGFSLDEAVYLEADRRAGAL